jgi:hypothetical protein
VKGLFGSRNVYSIVLDDIISVERSFEREKKLLSHSSSDDEYASKVLLCQFICDLLPGVSGKIFESKAKRDLSRSAGSSVRMKYVCGAVLLCLKTGMCVYVFLFSL